MLSALTPRQEECLRLTRLLTDREIAARLGISEPTVKKHVMEACQRLGVNRRKAGLAILEADDAEPDGSALRVAPVQSDLASAEGRAGTRFGYRPPPRDPFVRAVMIAVATVVCAVVVGALMDMVVRQHRQVRSIEVAIGNLEPLPASIGAAS